MDSRDKKSIFSEDSVDAQMTHEKAAIDQPNEVKPKVDIKSQENVLSGLSDKERAEAAEEDQSDFKADSMEVDHTARATVNSGLSDKERANATEADGKINTDNKGGLSDAERRDAADESW